MDSKRTKKERHDKNNWLDDIDKLEIQSKKMRTDASKVKSYHGKQQQESQVSNAAKAKEKWIVGNGNIGGKTSASGRERTTWNSRCGTDVGVFEKVTNDRRNKIRNSTAIAMPDDVSSERNTRKNVEPNDHMAPNTSNSVEQETVAMNINQESPSYDQEEEIQILKENVVKTPVTVMNIKQEKSSHQPKVIITLVSEHTEKDNRSLMQPTTELSGNEQICASKETVISTSIDKCPVGVSAFSSNTQRPAAVSAFPYNTPRPAEVSAFPSNTQSLAGASAFPSSTQLPERPGHNKTSHSFHFTQSGVTITPVGPSAANSFSTSSDAGETTRRILYGATRSRGSSPVNNGSGDTNGTTTSQSNSPVNNGLSQDGTTPVGPSATNSFSISSEAGGTTRYIQHGATISQSNSPANNRSGEITGRTQDGATISQSKSPISNRSGDITGRIQDGATASQGNSPGNNGRRDTTERVNNEAANQSTRSQGNLTINIGGGDLTLNNGGLTAQMKINDVQMIGPADDVANFFTKATRAVRDLVK